MTSMSESAVTEAVLFSSFKSAISQNMSPEFKSTIFFHQIEIVTLQDFIIYHSQFAFSHSNIIISH
jgi:hypothetical protein